MSVLMDEFQCHEHLPRLHHWAGSLLCLCHIYCERFIIYKDLGANVSWLQMKQIPSIMLDTDSELTHYWPPVMFQKHLLM